MTSRPVARLQNTAVFRAAWLVIAIGTLAVLITAVPARYQMLLDDAYGYGAPLAEMGLTLRFFAAYFLFWEMVLVGGSWLVGVIIAWRGRGDWFALLTAVTLMLFGFLPPLVDSLTAANIAWKLPIVFLRQLCLLGLMTVFSLFPNGRFVPRWLRFVLLGWMLNLVAIFLFFPDVLANTAVLPSTGTLQDALWLLYGAAWFVPIVGGQWYRYRRVSTAVEQQQTKWVILGFAIPVLFSVVSAILLAGIPGLRDDPATNTKAALTIGVIYIISALMLPITFALAIFRYRLWQIDIILNRTLVYGGLTAVILLIYGLVVGGFSLLWRSQNNLLVPLLATALIAALFQPVRERLQRTANKMTFGDRDDPATVLAQLGQRLEVIAHPDAVLPAIVETVAQTLKLPYVAIVLSEAGEQGSGGAGGQVMAAVGVHFDAPLTSFPLVYQTETVGQLQVAARSPHEVLNEADERVLRQVALQAGTAVHAIRLTTALQHSRERIVTAREEERRRIRRDLHDGLGPALASQTFALDTALVLLESDPPAAAKLLQTLKAQNKATVADIRRLVYALRPPTLDELGIMGALQAHLGQMEPGGVVVTLTAVPNPLPPLSAAAEVAAYRIILEAVTNTIRHAHARRCTVTLTAVPTPPQLHIAVADDGRGLPPNLQTGVGLRSMRERAEELGGRLLVENGEEGGVRITAVLPLAP